MAGRNGGRKKKPPSSELPKALAVALAEKKSSADSETLLRDLLEAWGGTRQLAMDIFAEFQKAAPGGMTRQRILEMFQRLILTNTSMEIGRAVKPSDLSDDELDELALSYVRRLSNGPPATTGQPEEGKG